LSVKFKSTRFIVVRRHDPLFKPHYPRRNQYGPVWEPQERERPCRLF